MPTSSFRKIPPPPPPPPPRLRQFRLGQPVVVVSFIESGGWRTLEERTSHLATTVNIPPDTKGMVVEVASASVVAGMFDVYKILWETEEVSWHHSSLILPIDADMAANMDTETK